MIQIKKIGEETYLELRQNTSFSLYRNSNFWHDNSLGEYTLPIEVDATPNNILFFGFANQWNKANRLKKIQVELKINGVSEGEYTLVLRSVSTYAFAVNLQKGNNFLLEICADRSLRDIDFGTLSFSNTTPQTVQATPIISEKYTAVAKDYTNEKTVFWAFWVENLPLNEMYTWLNCQQDFAGTVSATLQALANKINNGQYTGVAGFTAIAHANALVLIPPPAYTPFYAVANNFITAEKTDTGGLSGIDNYPFASTTNSKALILPKYSQCIFPYIYNKDFYDTEDFPLFSGYINRLANGYVQTNSLTETNATSNVVVPFVSVYHVLITLQTVLGITIESELMTDADWQELYIYSNKALDEKDAGTQFEYNRTKRTLNIAQHLPDIKILDFFKALESIGFFMQVVELGGNITLKFQTRQSVLNAVASAQDLFADALSIEQPKSFELDYEGDLNYENQPNFSKFDKVLLSTPDAESIENINFSFGTMHADGALLYDNQEGNSTMFDLQNEKDIPLRFVFYTAQYEDYLSASHTRNNKSLFVAGLNGLYQKYWQSYLAKRQNEENLKANLLLNSVQLRKLDLYKPIYAENACWLVKKITLKITNQTDSLAGLHEIELMKI